MWGHSALGCLAAHLYRVPALCVIPKLRVSTGGAGIACNEPIAAKTGLTKGRQVDIARLVYNRERGI